MSTQRGEAIKNTIQSLNDSLWTFGALTVLAESGGLAALKSPVNLAELARTTAIPEIALAQALNLFVDMGFVKEDHGQYQLTSDAHAAAAGKGLQQLIAQQQATFGKVQDLILSVREKRLQIGWHYQDPLVLQAQGLLSEVVATDFIPPGSEIAKMLMQPGAQMMDVGAGVAGISLKLCELYPHLSVTALEPGHTPFLLAQTNIKKSPYHNRVELRQQGMEDVKEQKKFDVAWIAQGFIADEHFLPGLAAMKSALKPGGVILTYGISSETPNRSMLINRFGASLYGGLRTVQQLIALLTNAGFHDAKISGEVLAGYKVITAVNPNLSRGS